MNIDVVANSLISLVSICVLGVLWLKAYPSFRIEEFRQDIFSLRDHMFDKAASEDINFEDKAYQILRMTMNGMINDAESITFVDFLVKIYLIRKYKSKNSERNNFLESALSSVDLNKRIVYQEYISSLSKLLIKFIIKRSLITYIFVSVLILLARWPLQFRKAEKKLRQTLEPATRETEYHAYRTGLSFAPSPLNC